MLESILQQQRQPRATPGRAFEGSGTNVFPEPQARQPQPQAQAAAQQQQHSLMMPPPPLPYQPHHYGMGHAHHHAQQHPALYYPYHAGGYVGAMAGGGQGMDDDDDDNDGADELQPGPAAYAACQVRV